MHAHVHMGNRPDDERVFAPQRRNRGLDLGLSNRMGGLHDGVCHHCRDGLAVRIEHAKLFANVWAVADTEQGANLRRAVPLGV